jgi:MFS family permease
MNANLWLLVACQGLFFTNNVTFIAINGLVGLSLAPLGWMATLPVMGYVVGGALSTGLVARTQKSLGRKMSFQIGLAVGGASSLLCAWAAYSSNFWLLVAATVVAGYYNANAQLYRFAAAELAAPAAREKAVSLVMAGGLIGAIAGPNLAAATKSLTTVPFAGAYFSLALVAVLGMLVLSFIEFPPAPPKTHAGGGRPLSEIARQPTFIIAAGAGALSYGVMNLRAAVFRCCTGAAMACDRHVRAWLFHRASDQAPGHAQCHDHRAYSQYCLRHRGGSRRGPEKF